MLTGENHVVVIHDSNTWRISRKLKWIRYTKLRKLKRIDIRIQKNHKYKGEVIPTLQEVLSTVPKGNKIIIEIKSSCKIIPYLKTVINISSLQEDQIEVISFSLKTLIEVRKQLSQYSIFWIRELDYSWIRKIFRPID